ncbi:MAG: extracellular solute-binding protein [Candidatus Binatia bacterium]
MVRSLSQIFQRTVWAVIFLLFWVIDSSVAAQAKPNWEQEWEKTLEAANKEGQVTVYIAGYEAILPEFEKAYPDIKLVAVPARGSELAQRVSAERRADKYLADVYSAGGGSLYRVLYLGKMLDPITPVLILPEVTDQSKWYQQKHHYSDPEGQYIFNYVGSATYGGIGYNTNLVKPKEFNSYWDLLEPKWKGKILARDIRVPGPGSGNARFFFHHPDLGAPFIRKLFGEMDVTLFRDYRQGPDWLAVGKYAICFSCDVDVLKDQGLPVDTIGPNVFKEGGAMVQQFGSLTLMNKAPHPNAAKVFINWLLSRRGQLAMQKRLADGESPADSLRIDIPKDDVPLLVRRVEGARYLDASNPKWLSMKPILKVMNEALTAAGKQ